MVIVKRAEEVSSAETPDSFGTVQFSSVVWQMLRRAKHLFDRTPCLFEIECLKPCLCINILDCQQNVPVI